MHTFRPEMELLCACVAPTQPPKPSQLEKGPVDWSRFVALATNHRTIPLAYRALKPTGILPDAVRVRLRCDSLAIAAHSLRAARILHRLQARAAEDGIDLIPIKGPTLALLAYGRESLRQFEDLDLVVRTPDFLRAVDILDREGYAPQHRLPAEDRLRYLATGQQWSLHKPRDPLYLELKPGLIWHALCGADSAAYLAAQCRPLAMDERRVLSAPGPEAMLLAVCVDGAKDMWNKLAAVADVAHLLAAFPDADWSGLLQDAARMGQRRSVLVAVRLAEQLLGMSPPPPLSDALRGDVAAWRLAAQAAHRLLRDCAPTAARQCVFAFQTRERFRDRARFMARLLFVPNLFEFYSAPLPPALHFLYTVLRPFRLAWDVCIRGGPPRRLVMRRKLRRPNA